MGNRLAHGLGRSGHRVDMLGVDEGKVNESLGAIGAAVHGSRGSLAYIAHPFDPSWRRLLGESVVPIDHDGIHESLLAVSRQLV
jgi:hypothetical protein